MASHSIFEVAGLSETLVMVGSKILFQFVMGLVQIYLTPVDAGATEREIE
jgi:hypothetical protein